jgi:geranylgeranyl pyrophosphate synthase
MVSLPVLEKAKSMLYLYSKEKESIIADFYLGLKEHLSTNRFLIQKEDFVPIITYHLNHSVLDGGKRLRPILCFLMGQLFELEFKKVLPFARIAEMIHAATLAHDDVIDESERRRNRPTLNSKTSNTHAVLAGDYLLSESINELAELGYRELMVGMTNTLQALVQGEWLQLEARDKVEVSADNLEVVSKLKTASVMSWCCMVAPVISQHSADMVRLCRDFGEYLGIAFQMVDDTLDFKKDGEKSYALDLKEGLINFVACELIDIHPPLLQEFRLFFKDKTQDIDKLPLTPPLLEQARQNVLRRAETKVTASKEILKEIYETLGTTHSKKSEKAYQELENISNEIIRRSK